MTDGPSKQTNTIYRESQKKISHLLLSHVEDGRKNFRFSVVSPSVRVPLPNSSNKHSDLDVACLQNFLGCKFKITRQRKGGYNYDTWALFQLDVNQS